MKVRVTLAALAATTTLAACGSSTTTTVVHSTTAPPVTTTATTPAPAPAPAPTPAPKTTTSFPPTLERSYMKGCESANGATPAVCGCELKYLEAHTPLTTIIGYQKGTLPAWLLNAAKACVGAAPA